MKALRIASTITTEHIVPLSYYFDDGTDGTTWWGEDRAQKYEQERRVPASEMLTDAHQQAMLGQAKFERVVTVIEDYTPDD